ncbi:YjgB family protein [Clostridium psychrophilum]|uniref:YjgB family protein n=1 Tax=Clostridium psychrophilum TaxID=132926 RepID=UPI001FE419F1|nr:YjgB family protein [Clostridium psychrophilum]
MISTFKKVLKVLPIPALILTIMVGCSSAPKSATKNTNSTVKSTVNNTGTTKNAANNTTTNQPAGKLVKNTSNIENTSQKTLITNVFNLAKQGKVINSDFSAKTTDIDTVYKKLGKADKIDYVAKAKGNYATFTKYKLVFGFNKGSQIFEVRSFDDKISKVSLSMVKKTLGSPAYDVKSNGQVIIGYKTGQEYKLLLVFNDSSKSNSDPLIDHYSVLYPKGTVNSMANDSGREW